MSKHYISNNNGNSISNSNDNGNINININGDYMVKTAEFISNS